ncbi:MAG: hypothetical protein MUC96_09045 [Myxococcaceae bacterium]|jgi:hypothetical protein|nr:hypothetical protein [Myxococcaceae bacterium]
MPMTVVQFEAVCRAIFEAGDRQTYCNRFNDNPHVDAGWFEAWVDPARAPRCRTPEEAAALTLRPIPFEGNYARLIRAGDVIEVEPARWTALRLAHAIHWLLDYAYRAGKLSGPPNPR